MKWVQMKQDFITFMRRGTAQCNGSYRIALHSIYCINGILTWVSIDVGLPKQCFVTPFSRRLPLSTRCSARPMYLFEISNALHRMIFDKKCQNFTRLSHSFKSNFQYSTIIEYFEQTYLDVSWHQYRWREKDRAGYANCACLPATLAKIIW